MQLNNLKNKIQQKKTTIKYCWLSITKTLQTVEELSPLYEYICQMAYKAVADLDFIDCDIALTEAWLNVNDSRQCMNTEHIHGEVFSGVFYLQARR